MPPDPTLTARHPYSGGGEPYTDIYGEEDWYAMTQADRQAIIDEDLAAVRADAEAEAEAEDQAEADSVKYDALCAALDTAQTQAERLISDCGLAIRESIGSGGSSRYIWVAHNDADGDEDLFKVRISDHAQPPGGGYNPDSDARHGEADVCLDIRHTPEHNAELLRDAIASRTTQP